MYHHELIIDITLFTSMAIKTNKENGLQQQQQSLILLGGVGYMDHTTPFSSVKDQRFSNIIMAFNVMK